MSTIPEGFQNFWHQKFQCNRFIIAWISSAIKSWITKMTDDWLYTCSGKYRDFFMMMQQCSKKIELIIFYQVKTVGLSYDVNMKENNSSMIIELCYPWAKQFNSQAFLDFRYWSECSTGRNSHVAAKELNWNESNGSAETRYRILLGYTLLFKPVFRLPMARLSFICPSLFSTYPSLISCTLVAQRCAYDNSEAKQCKETWWMITCRFIKFTL